MQDWRDLALYVGAGHWQAGVVRPARRGGHRRCTSLQNRPGDIRPNPARRRGIQSSMPFSSILVVLLGDADWADFADVALRRGGRHVGRALEAGRTEFGD
uniref:Uncharacterized protein n=1 Tax=Mycena chlorophos TaxID=658473 RepID=A0ABQ0KWQ1_MYCCL|nr:predicted protein [Mycena chlorophos]